MGYRDLGGTGLQVSAIGFGSGNIGGLMVRGEHAEQRKAVAAAIEAGVSYFDTAAQYGEGRSEENLGQVLRELHARFDALLCPTMAFPPPAAEGHDQPEGDLDMTTIFNLTSPCPALSVPFGFTAGALPVGLQVVARRHRAAEALRIGLVQKVLPLDGLLDEARRIAGLIASKAPLAVAAAKRAIVAGASQPLPDALGLEALLFGQVVASEDFREGSQAFLDKRKPSFSGR